VQTQGEEQMKPIAWYDPTNGMVSTDKDSPLFTPLGQVWPLYTNQEQEPVQVSPLEFVEMVMEKEHLIGNPIFWAEWPNKEKNNG
jgi:hypothetical protein